jgi:hypothetical protein
LGLADISKWPGWATLTVTVAVCVVPPEDPVTVTVYAPGFVVAPVETVRMELGMLWKKLGAVKVIEVLLRLGFSVPVPDTAAERFTVPAKPFKAPRFILNWAELPALTVAESWAGDR